MDKSIPTVAEAIAAIPDGSTVMIGGFGGSGTPIELEHALLERFRKTGSPNNLTIINNNAGTGDVGLGALIKSGMVRKLYTSYPLAKGWSAFRDKYLAGEIELELVPQGTLIERIRAGGAGTPAFYTPTSYGTDLGAGKPVAEFDGKMYVQERWLKADFALIKGQTGDLMGNLTYRLTSRNFNPAMAAAATYTIAQVGTLLPVGGIDPELVITPGILVNAIVEVADAQQETALVRQGFVA